MSYLSKVIVRNNNPRARVDFADGRSLHRTIMSAFPDAPDKAGGGRSHFNVLFRAEERGQHSILIVQSDTPPEWAKIASRFPGYIESYAVKETSSLYGNILEGSVLRFRLRANTIKTLDKKRVPLHDPKEQMEWLQSRSQRLGFLVLSAIVTPYDQRFPLQFQIGPATCNAADFEGTLQVTDRTQFLSSIQNGIGHGKAFGLGLLSVGLVQQVPYSADKKDT